jgi:exopolysaccharide production protein ExoZ
MIFAAGRLGQPQNWGSQSWLQFLGRVSYSLYLVHYPVLHVVENAGLSLTGNTATSAVLWLLVSLACSIGAAQILYVCVEAPSVRLAARFKRSSPRPALETARS